MTLDLLNAVSDGWTESYPGGMLCNPNDGGGIIDSTISDDRWFVVFNDHDDVLEGFLTREEAVEVFVRESGMGHLLGKDF